MKIDNVLNVVENISYLLPPFPVVLISTISKFEERNLAPVGHFMIISYMPPMVAFAMHTGSDTLNNISNNKQFVVGVPTIDSLRKVYKCADSIPSHEDEFIYSNLTAYKSKFVRPDSIDDCCVNLECKMQWMKEIGDHWIICGQVINASVEDKLLYSATQELMIKKNMDMICHLDLGYFTVGYKKMICVEETNESLFRGTN